MADNDNNENFEDKAKKFFGAFLKEAGNSLADAVTKDPKTGFQKGAFFSAIKRNDTKALEKILSSHTFDINTYNAGGYTGLHVAARSNSPEAALMLIDNGADPLLGKEDDKNTTPLVVAVNSRKVGVADVLARHGGYVSGSTVDGWSLLHRACEKGEHEIVDVLVRAGADCNEKTRDGRTPLLIAIAQNRKEVVKTLINFPAVFNTIDESYIAGDVEQRKVLHRVVEAEDLDILKAFVEKGASLNVEDAYGRTPLNYAIEHGDLEAIKLLVKSGANLNANHPQIGSPLFYTCFTKSLKDEQREEIITTLLNLGADPDLAGPKGMTPLHALVVRSAIEEPLNTLIQYPISKNVKDASGASPLMLASVHFSRTQHIKPLINAGSNLNTRHGEDGSTPLIQAVKKNNLVAIGALLENGASARKLDCHNRSALSYAREKKLDAIISVLEDSLKTKGKKPSSPSM